MSTSNLYEIKKITQQDKENVLLFLQKTFYKDEPLNVYLNTERGEEIISKDRGRTSLDVINEELSFMAVSHRNEIIGVCINEVYKENSINDDHPNVIKIKRIVHKLEEGFADLIKLQNVDRDKVLSVKQIATNSEWRNKGIGLVLIMHTMEFAREKGFCLIETVCTSEFSAKIFGKLGFQCINSIKYEDYKENGKVVFKPDFPHTEIKSMLLKM